MTHKPTSRAGAAAIAAFVFAGAIAAHAQGSAPRYLLAPSQELVYEHTSKTRGGYESSGQTTIHLWVVGAIDGGGWRVLLREQRASRSAGRDQQETVELIGFDLFSDGRVESATFSYGVDPGRVFPALPAEAEGEWRGTRFDEPLLMRTLDADEPERFKFEAVAEGAIRRIYGLESRQVYTFDLERGVIAKSEGTMRQSYGINMTGESALTLKSSRVLDEAEARDLAGQAAIYFAALEGMRSQITDERQIERHEAVLRDAAERIEHPMLAPAAEQQLAQYRQMGQYLRQRIEERSARIGQPAEEWELRDLEGNVHRLADYRGKVVVLDFWYRGCGWCIRAMPAIKHLADDFADEAVAILGMNTDRNVDDARFVAEVLELNYPTLIEAHAMPERYGVRGFPTLIVIDREGVTREVHVGWSPNLREEIARAIRPLL